MLITCKKIELYSPLTAFQFLCLFSSNASPHLLRFHLPWLYPDLPDDTLSGLSLFVSGFLGFTEVIAQPVPFKGECMGTLRSAPSQDARTSFVPLAHQQGCQTLMAPPKHSKTLLSMDSQPRSRELQCLTRQRNSQMPEEKGPHPRMFGAQRSKPRTGSCTVMSVPC